MAFLEKPYAKAERPDTINSVRAISWFGGYCFYSAVNKQTDVITRGAGTDIVFADVIDVVDSKSCEIVRY